MLVFSSHWSDQMRPEIILLVVYYRGKFSLRYLSLITETCAPVSSKTEENLLFSKTLRRHFSPINPVTLCLCCVDRLTVYGHMVSLEHLLLCLC